jgi:hypothetical protein
MTQHVQKPTVSRSTSVGEPNVLLDGLAMVGWAVVHRSPRLPPQLDHHHTLDVTRSVAAAERIAAQKKGCYANALLTMYSYEAYQRGWSVEGFAIPDITGVRIPFEHGWVELPGGTIIDPSFAALGRRDVTYFPPFACRGSVSKKCYNRVHHCLGCSCTRQSDIVRHITKPKQPPIRQHLESKYEEH